MQTKDKLLLHCAGQEAVKEYSHFVYTDRKEKDCKQEMQIQGIV